MDDLNSTVDWTFNNTFYTPNGRIAVHCNKATSWTLAQYQQMGYDLKSTEAVSPPLETLIEWSRELIALPSLDSSEEFSSTVWKSDDEMLWADTQKSKLQNSAGALANKSLTAVTRRRRHGPGEV